MAPTSIPSLFMRLLRGYVGVGLLVLASCGDDGPSAPTCGAPEGHSNATFSIASVSPSEISVHQASLSVHLEGNLPALEAGQSELFEAFVFTGDSEPENGLSAVQLRDAAGALITEVNVEPLALAADQSVPFAVSIVREVYSGEETTRTKASLRCAGTLVPSPAAAELTRPSASDLGLDFPLPAELGSVATRTATFSLKSTGDEPLRVDAIHVDGASGFSASACPATMSYGETCSIGLRFAATEPGSYDARLVIDSNVAIEPALVHAEVLPRVDGLDSSFSPVMVANASLGSYLAAARPVSLWDNDTIALSNLAGVRRIDQVGVSQLLPIGDVWSLSRDAISATAYGSTQGVSELLRFDRDGGVDKQFAASRLTGPAVAVQSSGRVLAFDSGTVLAFTHAGAVDTSYGAGGRVPIDGIRVGVLDGADRLYVPSSTGVVRLGAEGTPEPLDPGFVVAALAADPQGRVVVTDGSSFVRYDLANGSEPLPIAGVTGVTHIVYDSMGRLYLDHGQGGLSMRALPDHTVEVVPHLGVDDLVNGYEMFVTCPPQGACWVSGTTGQESYIARLDG